MAGRPLTQAGGDRRGGFSSGPRHAPTTGRVTIPRPSDPPFDAPRARLRRGPAFLLALALALLGVAADPTGSQAPDAGAITATGASFTFTGSGWGHGVGMSQWGARGLAEAGRSHTQILTNYYRGATVTTRAVSDGLRVLVAERRPTVTLVAGGHTTFNGVGNVAAGGTVTLTRSGNDIVLSGALNKTVAAPLTVRYAGSGDLKLVENGVSYRYGELAVRLDSSGLRVVVAGLAMQDYLYGLAEMPASWHAQALRAQVVAARTFAQKRRDQRWGSGLDYDLLSTVTDQAYAGTKHQDPRWMSAVDVTAGQVVTYGGGLIDAVYHSSSGGHTENSEYVWVSTVPYLRGAPDPFDAVATNPHNSWTRSYTGAQLGAWSGLGVVSTISITGSIGVSGRTDRATVTLTGTGGTKTYTGVQFRSLVNSRTSSQLMSTKYTVTGVGTPPSSSPPTGNFHTAIAQGRTVVIGGTASDRDGIPVVRIVSTMGTQVAVRETRPVDGHFLVTWAGAPGTRRVCVSVLDVPTGAPTSLGCRDVVVK